MDRREFFINSAYSITALGILLIYPQPLTAMEYGESIDTLTLNGLKAVATPFQYKLNSQIISHDYSDFRHIAETLTSIEDLSFESTLNQDREILLTLNELANVICSLSQVSNQQKQLFLPILNYLEERPELLTESEAIDFLYNDKATGKFTKLLKSFKLNPELVELAKLRKQSLEKANYVKVIQYHPEVDVAEHGYYPYQSDEENILKDLVCSLNFFLNQKKDCINAINNKLISNNITSSFAFKITNLFATNNLERIFSLIDSKLIIEAEYYKSAYKLHVDTRILQALPKHKKSLRKQYLKSLSSFQVSRLELDSKSMQIDSKIENLIPTFM